MAAKSMHRIALLAALAGPLAAAAPGALRAQTTFYVYEPRVCGRLGVAFTKEEPVTIREVQGGSPADRAGVRPGDVLVRINGETASLSAILAFTQDLEPGDTVRIHFRRGGADRETELVAARDLCVRRIARTVRPPDSDPTLLALRLRDSTIVLRFDSMRSEWADVFAELMRRDRAERDRARSDWAALLARIDQRRRMQRDSMLDRWLREQRATRDSLIASLYERQKAVARLRVAAPRRAGPAIIQPWSVGWHAVAGAEFSELNEGLAQYFQGATEGLLVLRVAPQTPGARAGLRPGDIVVRAGTEPIRTVADLRFVVATAEQGRVPLVVVRKGTRLTLTLPPER